MEEIYKFWGRESSPGKCSSVEIKILHKSRLTAVDFKKNKRDCQTECILMFRNTSFLVLSCEVIVSIHFLSALISLELSANNKQINKRAMEFSFQDYLKCFSFAAVWSKSRV